MSNNNISAKKEYKTTINDFKNHFNSNITHSNLMSFVLESQGINNAQLNKIIYSKIFTPQLVSFLDSFKINGKYNVKLFLAASQKEVLDKVIEPIKANKAYIPKTDEIHLWLVNYPNKGFDSDYIEIILGTQVAKDFKNQQINLEGIKNQIKTALKNEKLLKHIEEGAIDKNVKSALVDSFIVNYVNEDFEKNPSNREVFESSPGVYVTLKFLGLLTDYIKAFKLKPNYWDKTDSKYSPLLNNTIENAFLCGVINGIIDELAGIPEAVDLFFTLVHSETAYNEFKDAIKKLLEEENLLVLLIEGALKKYVDSKTPEEAAYHFGHDAIQIVSLIIGVFQLAKGIASFVNFTKKAFLYLKRYGKDGLDNLKKLNQKQIKEVFDDLDEQKPS